MIKLQKPNKHEPIRQHYIPQFILRNFCFDDSNSLFFYSLKDKTVSVKNTRDVFMEKQLYNSSFVNPNDPSQIEKDFAKYEQEIGYLIKTKILNKHEISLTLKEEASLRFFCALLAFRSKNAVDIFSNLSGESKAMYSEYQNDGNFVELWKRNLSVLVKCRSFDDVVNNDLIDKPIKSFMMKDCFGIFGKYFVFFEKRGPVDFIIGDCYPVAISGSADSGLSLELISFYPVTPYLCFALVNVGSEHSPCMLGLKKYLKTPWQKGGILTYTTQKLYEHDISNINQGTIINSHFGVAFKNKERSGLDV